MKRISTFLLIIIMLSANTVNADDSRNRGNGFLMAEEPVGPRNTAMGSAGTALSGSGFRYYNPAQPFFSAQPYANAEFGQIPGGVFRGGFESAMLFPEWFTAISFHTSSVDFETRDERGFGSTASSSTTFGALSLGYIRDDNLALAVSVSMLDDRIWVSSNYSAVAISAGVGYKMLDGKLNLGAAWLNGAAWSRGFGDGSDANVWHDGRVPMFARAGAAWSDTVGPFPYTVAADVAYRDEDGTFSLPVGAEVQILPYINLRIGKRVGWESEILSLGIGFNLDRIAFDAAFVPTVFVDEYEIKWNMGFTYNMGRKRKPAAATEPAKPVESPKPEVSLEPEPADSAVLIDSAVTTDSTESAISTDSTTSIDSTESTESTEPSDTTASPEDSSVDTDGTDDADDAKNDSIDSPESTESSKSSESSESSKPTEPTESKESESIETTAPPESSE